MKKPDQAVIDETWWYATQYTIVVGVGPTNMMGCECCGSANEIYSVHGQGKIHVGLYGIFCLVCGRGLRVTDDNSVIERDLTRVLPRWEENDFSAEVIHLVPKAQNDGNLHLQHSLPHRPTSHSSGALTFWANSGILEAHPAH